MCKLFYWLLDHLTGGGWSDLARICYPDDPLATPLPVASPQQSLWD